MPRIDPHTGCTVSTFWEVMEDAGEVYGEIANELAAETEQQIADMNDPVKALEVLVRCSIEEQADFVRCNQHYGSDDTLFGDELPPPVPVEVLEVRGAGANQRFSGDSAGSFTAKVRCADGSTRWVVYSYEYEAPSWDGPGGGGEGLEWLDGEPA